MDVNERERGHTLDHSVEAKCSRREFGALKGVPQNIGGVRWTHRGAYCSWPAGEAAAKKSSLFLAHPPPSLFLSEARKGNIR